MGLAPLKEEKETPGLTLFLCQVRTQQARRRGLFGIQTRLAPWPRTSGFQTGSSRPVLSTWVRQPELGKTEAQRSDPSLPVPKAGLVRGG